jgi:two-component system cell cycle response regulator CtrA
MSELERLRDRVRELEEILGMDVELPNQLGFTPVENKIVGLLIKRPVVSKEVLYTTLYGDRPECEQPDIKIFDVYICKLRKKLKVMNIQIYSRYTIGYYIDDDAKATLQSLNRVKPILDLDHPHSGRRRDIHGKYAAA